jgi:protein-S-isoprenylcysteine O-methyltransferase Ste14
MNAAQAASFPLIAFGITEFVLRQGSTAKTLKTTATDRGTTALIFACYVIVVCVLCIPRLPGIALPQQVGWIGIGVAVAGLLLRWWAMLVLGRFYTRTLITTSDQNVVTRGPYRCIRHPGYLGSLMTWVGAAAASRNLVVVLVVAALLLVAYWRRISAEEVMLTERLGKPYADYWQRSWRLVPFVF